MAEAAQLITSIATLVAALSAVFLSWRSVTKIEQVHIATNGLTSKLVSLTATASKAEGNLEGRAELKEEQKAP